MIYGFLQDEVFQDPSLNIKNLREIDLQYGYLNNQALNYFNEPLEIGDIRSDRLKRFQEPLLGEMDILIDSVKSEDDVEIVANSGPTAINSIFNILEFVFYRISIDSASSMDNTLVTNDGTYPGYISGSMNISSQYKEVHIYSVVDNVYPVLHWVEFGIEIEGVEIYFKIWVNRESFLEQYPLSTICEIVPPLSYELLLDPSSVKGTMAAATASSNISASKLSTKIQESGYTDYISYPTKYIEQDGTMTFIPFNILYKGNSPSTLEMRQAIRELLLSLELAEEDGWKEVLPDLFVAAQFFIIPIWDNLTERPTRVIYPSIVGINKIKTIVDTILYDIEEDVRENKLEVLDLAYSEILMVSCPDHLNQSDTSLRQEHPTYQRYGPTDPAYNYQQDHTKFFTNYLNRAVAVAAGETTDTIFIMNNFNDRVYASFVVNEIEYHVMTRASYLNNINSE